MRKAIACAILLLVSLSLYLIYGVSERFIATISRRTQEPVYAQEEVNYTRETSQSDYEPETVFSDEHFGQTEDDPPSKSVTIEPFIPSTGFAGSRHGYVFKMGDKGLGYYLDDVATLF